MSTSPDVRATPVPPTDRPAAWRRTSPASAGRRAWLLATLWSTATVLHALAWALELLPHPFGDRSQALVGAVFNTSHPRVGTAFTLVLGLIGVASGVTLLRSRHDHDGDRHGAGVAVEAIAWLVPAVTALVLIHGSVIAFLGYTPLALTIGWFDAELKAAYLAGLARPDTIFLLSCVVGALLWGRAALTFRRARLDACLACGRVDGWTPSVEAASRGRALRIGRLAVTAGIVSALVYPAVRLPWLLGHPAGMDAASWARLQATEGAVETGVALGTVGVVGAVLMLGLVAGWGVRFPGWMVGLSGRRVPVRLAVVPASLVAVALVASGRGFLSGALLAGPDTAGEIGAVHVLPLIAMLPWGLALGVATAAYAVRRRGRCEVCGRGTPEVLPSS